MAAERHVEGVALRRRHRAALDGRYLDLVREDRGPLEIDSQPVAVSDIEGRLEVPEAGHHLEFLEGVETIGLAGRQLQEGFAGGALHLVATAKRLAAVGARALGRLHRLVAAGAGELAADYLGLPA